MTTIEHLTTADALIAQSKALRAEFAALVEDVSYAMANLHGDLELLRRARESKTS